MPRNRPISSARQAVVVAVPARGEVRRLPALLGALARQRGAPPFELLLLLDGADDGSADLVAHCSAELPYSVSVIPGVTSDANAGRARGAVCAAAAARTPDGIVLTTDADSAPGARWIAANLAALAHADVVAGRIVRRGGRSPVADRIEDYLDRLHRLRRHIDPVGWEDVRTHHWTSGASLGMRAVTYHVLGGFPAVPVGEDAAIADHASRLGLRLRRDARVVVRTSARRRGRVAGGFASALAAYDRPGAMPLVAHPADELWRYRRHAAARLAFADPSADRAALLGFEVADLRRICGEVANGEALAARAVGAPPGGMRRVPLPLAEALIEEVEAACVEPLRGAA